MNANTLNPHFSHLLVTKRRKGRPGCVAPRTTEAPALRVAQSGRIIVPMQ